jgi:hypothetical protein
MQCTRTAHGQVRVFRQLIRAELPRCEAATWSGDELASVLQLVSYKWFVPLFVNQARLTSLMTHTRMHMYACPHSTAA